MNKNNKRILLVDDNINIHEDFRKILEEDKDPPLLDETVSMVFGETLQPSHTKTNPFLYHIDSAFQSEEAIKLVKKAVSDGSPYALAFIDVRMPPGQDGIEIAKQIWKVDSDIQIVICTAYSDYLWEDITQQFKDSDNFLILKKPFDPIEVSQLASALTKKWLLKQEIRYQIENLKTLVNHRTAKLKKSNHQLETSFSLIKATLESTQEGIVVVDKAKKEIVINNKKFLELWNISQDFIKANHSEVVFQKLANQVKESFLFLNMMTHLCDQPESGVIREWETKTDKTLELYIQPQFLRDKVIGTVFSFRDVTARKRLEEELRHQATHDSLTGLPNRVLLIDRIHQAITLAKRQHNQVAILIFDLDNFKQINDTLGHNAGDALLKLVAQKLSANVREFDTVSRFGGDEFVVVLTTQGRKEDLILKIQDLLKLFLLPYEFENRQLAFTASIGVSIYPKDGSDSEILLKNADTALYHAKQTGRNNFQFYVPEFSEHILQQVELTAALRQAIEKNELMLYYQPLVELDSDKIIGVEALLRWKHSDLGMLSPDLFIPLAEETGLIVPIGAWVLKQACLQAKTWQKSGYPELSIAVNVSGYQFRQEGFVDSVRQVLKETDLDPKFLELEITESFILGHKPKIAEKMRQLKELGVSLTMDDFGTGYSSLSYLKYFPFDKIKIDKSFIDGITSNIEDSSVVEAIINMTKTLGLQVLAEGVEKSDQVDILRHYHANQMQGYYFSPPIDVQMLTDLLKSKTLSKP